MLLLLSGTWATSLLPLQEPSPLLFAVKPQISANLGLVLHTPHHPNPQRNRDATTIPTLRGLVRQSRVGNLFLLLKTAAEVNSAASRTELPEGPD